MGAQGLKRIKPDVYSHCQPMDDHSHPTSKHPRVPTDDNTKPPFTLKQLWCEDQSVVYQATVGDVSFSFRATQCPCEHGEISLVHNQQVYGAIRNTNGELNFKHRINLNSSCSLDSAIEEFCLLKMMSVLEIGVSIGKILDSDCEIYPNYLQYYSEMPITQYRGVSNKTLAEQINGINETLRNHHLKYVRDEESSKGFCFSPAFRKFVLTNGQVSYLQPDVWQVIPENKIVIEHAIEQTRLIPTDGELLSVESNVQKQYDKMIRNHDASLKQILRLHEAINSLNSQLNRLQNHIYAGNRQTELLIREKIERDLLRDMEKKQLEESVKFYTCLEHFYSRTKRVQSNVEVIKKLLELDPTNPQSQHYSHKLALLLNDELSISKLAMEQGLRNESCVWLSSLSRMYFDKHQDRDALSVLEKSCSFESGLDNGAFVLATEVLFENNMISKAKQYLSKGIQEGHRKHGPYYLNNSRLYNILGLVLVHEGEYYKSLQAFSEARRTYETLNFTDLHYFEILGNEFSILDRLLEFDKGYALFKNHIEKRIPEIKRTLQPSEFMRLFSNIGTFLFNSCRFAEARTALGQCLKYTAAWPSLDNNAYVRMFTNLACIQLKDKDAKAENYFKYALDRQSESFRVRTDLVTSETSYHLHNNLALFYYRKGEIRRSITEFEEVQQAVGQMAQDPRFKESFVHLNYNISCVYKKALRTDKAMEYLEEALRLAKEHYGDTHELVEAISLDLESMNKQRIMELTAEDLQSMKSMVAMKGQTHTFAAAKKPIS